MATTLPREMQAVVLTEVGGIEHVSSRRVDVPQPATGEVLIRVATVAVNRQDLSLILGKIPTDHLSLPHILGLDPAGTVVATGAGTAGIALGDRVVVKPPVACGACAACVAGEDDACEHIVSIGIHRPGGMADYVAVPATNVAAIHERLSFAAATAVAHSFPVALTLLRRVGLSAADTVLVSGGAGAVGSASVQLARSMGARVIAAVGGPEGAAWLADLPPAVRPDAIVEYGAGTDLTTAARAVAPDGVDVYVETASDPGVWEQALAAVARRGRIAVIGSHAGPIVKLNTNWLFRQRVTIYGCSGSTLAAFHEVLRLAAEGAIVPAIDTEMPVSGAADAYRRLLTRQNRGKVVLRVADDDANE